MKARRLIANLAVVLAMMSFAQEARGIDPDRLLPQYLREDWGIERGFTGGSVTSIAQTSDGYLWVGTERGLIRFDGLNFRGFQQQTPTTLPIGPVQGLAADSHSNLWVLLANTTVLRYHEGKFEPGRDEAAYGITSVGRRRDGSPLLSSLALGPLTFHNGKFEVLTTEGSRAGSASSTNPTVNDDLSSRLSWATGVVTHRFAKVNSSVTAMAETSDRTIWLGTRERGLFYLKGGQIHGVPQGTDDGKINCLLAMGKDELWAGTDKGVMRWNGSKLTHEGVPRELWSVPVLTAIRDKDANIWLGSSSGLLRVNAHGVSSDGEVTTRSKLAVTSLFEDREGDIWVGTTHGIERLRDSSFVSYAVMEGLPLESGGPVYIDSEDRTWFAPLDGGLHRLKGGQIESVTAADLDKDVVYSITGSPNELWLGRQRGGLTQLRFANGLVEAKTYTHKEGLLQNSVYTVLQSHDGTVWAGTLSGGLSKFQKGRFISYTTANGMSSNSVTAIAEGSDGVMWFGAPNGLNSFSNGKWRLFTEGDGLPAPDINCLLEDSTHVLWIGTTAGLVYLSAGAIHVPRDVPATLHEQIFGIAEDKNGWLWIATSSHVLRVRHDELVSGKIQRADIQEYGLDDGLWGVEGVKRERSIVVDKSGSIWFSMNHGLSVVNPNRTANRTVAVLARVDAVSADGVPFDLAESVRIPSDHQRTTFDFSGLSLSVPERVRYRYRLDGFDRDWSQPGTVREAIYTNLRPGTYRFRVIASTRDGVWTGDEASLDLTIVPQFYQTSWFLLACAAAIATIAWATYQWHVGQVTSRLDMQFVERLSERTRIARELHDTLLQSFQGLILHFQTARDLLPKDPAEAGKRLDMALESADQAMVEGRNAIYGMRSSGSANDDLAHAINALGEELGANQLSGTAPKFSVVEEGTAKPLDPIFRDDVYHIIKEALRNSFNHAAAQNIEAEITYGKRLLRVRIRDDGQGIDPRVLVEGERIGHWGLPGMRERAKRISGRLAVWSEPGAGTEVELSLPGSLVYESASSLGLFRFFGRNGRSKTS